MQTGKQQDLFKSLIANVVLSAAFLLNQPLKAAELSDLYQARVPAGQSQAQWQRQAMQDVLLKLTGSADVISQPALAEPLKNSGQFVVQYQQIQQDGQALLLVTLDGQKITRILQNNQIPIWGARRPDVLLWLTERPIDQPKFVLRPEHPLRKALQSEAQRFGLSIQFPLYDETDLALVNETVSWGGDFVLLQQASERYKATEIYNLLFDQVTDASGLVQFRLTWQQLVDGQVQSQELINADAMVLAQQFCAGLAGRQATRYAVLVSSGGDSTGSELRLTFDGVNSLTDLHYLRQLLGSMLTVRDHSVVQYSAGQAILAVQLAASQDDFYRALSLVRELTPQPDAAAVGITSDTTAETVSGTTEPATTNGSQPEAVDPSLDAAEQAMEAALANHKNDAALPDVPAADVPATASPTGQVVPESAPAISSHYLLRRL